MPEQFGRYEVIDKLGKGGMAEVYLARDPEMERQVAIKVLPTGPSLDDTSFLRFYQESRTIANLEHPAIVPIYDVGDEDGRPFFVMRYMTGGKLTQYLAQGSLPIEAILEIMRRVASALDKAHRTGIVHRDLKPDNILLDEDGKAYLSDFGIAKLLESNNAFTANQAILGTFEYMSPEQIQAGHEVDSSTDIYALGVLLYQMLTGRPPYIGTPAEIMTKHVLPGTPNILDARPDLPAACEHVIAKAMAKDKVKRFATAMEMAEALAVAFGRSLDPSDPLLPKWQMEVESTSPSEAQAVNSGFTSLLPQSVMTTSIILQRRFRQLPTWARWAMIIIPLAIVAYLTSRVEADGGEPTATAVVAAAATTTSTPLPPTLTPSPEAAPTSAAEILRVLRAGEGALWEVEGVLERIPADGRLSLTTAQTLTLQTDASRLELLLPDSTKLYLDSNTILEIVSMTNGDEAAETAVYLREGHLAIEPAASPITVIGPDKQHVQTAAGLTGVDIVGQFALVCLETECHFATETAEPIIVRTGQAFAFTADDVLFGPFDASIEPYIDLLNPIAALTATPTATFTPTPTGTPTETATPTIDPTRFGPEAVEIGPSVLGQPIEAVRFGDGPEVFIFVAGLQGGYAPNAVALAQQMIAYLSDNLQLIPERATLYIISHLNPDSPEMPGIIDGRLNANGVDLNRNWPCSWDKDPWILTRYVENGGGAEPYSEPETKALVDFIADKEPTAVFFWMAHRKDGFVSPGGCEVQSLVSLSLSQLYAQAANYGFYESTTGYEDFDIQGDASNSLDDLGIPVATALLPLFHNIDWEENLAGTLAVLNEYTPPSRPAVLTVTTPVATTSACLENAASRWMTTLYAEFATQLGCPLTNEQHPEATYQLYKNGLLLWRKDTQRIYALHYEGSFATYDADLSLGLLFDEGNWRRGPIGYLWDSNGPVQEQLGEPQGPEMGTSEFTLQDFMKGTIFYFKENQQNTYVLLGDAAELRMIQEK